MMRITFEQLLQAPWVLVLLFAPVALQAYRFIRSDRRDLTHVALKGVELANAVLKPTLSTTNKKQIYLTEQLFRTTYKYPFDYREIVALLGCNRPSLAIEQYLHAKVFLEYSTDQKVFVEKKGAWFSWFGKGPKLTDLILLVWYFVFGFLGVMIIQLTSTHLTKRLAEKDVLLSEHFIAEVIFFAISLGLIAAAFKCLWRIGSKVVADKFLEDNFLSSAQ
ncbi:MAG: hypothetical protein ACPG4U_04505 [Pseudomonadales bacterium]